MYISFSPGLDREKDNKNGAVKKMVREARCVELVQNERNSPGPDI